jgi:hypothetical protein
VEEHESSKITRRVRRTGRRDQSGRDQACRAQPVERDAPFLLGWLACADSRRRDEGERRRDCRAIANAMGSKRRPLGSSRPPTPCLRAPFTPPRRDDDGPGRGCGAVRRVHRGVVAAVVGAKPRRCRSSGRVHAATSLTCARASRALGRSAPPRRARPRSPRPPRDRRGGLWNAAGGPDASAPAVDAGVSATERQSLARRPLREPWRGRFGRLLPCRKRKWWAPKLVRSRVVRTERQRRSCRARLLLAADRRRGRGRQPAVKSSSMRCTWRSRRRPGPDPVHRSGARSQSRSSSTRAVGGVVPPVDGEPTPRRQPHVLEHASQQGSSVAGVGRHASRERHGRGARARHARPRRAAAATGRPRWPPHPSRSGVRFGMNPSLSSFGQPRPSSRQFRAAASRRRWLSRAVSEQTLRRWAARLGGGAADRDRAV